MKTLKEKIEFLKTCDTSSVSDAYIRLGMSDAIGDYCIDGIKCAPLNREDSFVGIISTVQFSMPEAGQKTYDLFDLVSTHEPGTVFVMSGCGDRCYTGDVFVKYAAMEGMSAFVIEGLIRDIEGIASAGMPVFCAGATTKAKGGTAAKITSYGEDISFHGVRVNSGDIMIGDADGVVIIPLNILDDIIYQLEDIRQLENEYLNVFEENTDVLQRLRAIGKLKSTKRV